MSNISYDDFAKLDIRVAKIIATEPIEGKSRIIKGRIDLGNNDQRDVIIGGAQYYQPEDIVEKTVIVIANLEPKKMAGVFRNCQRMRPDIPCVNVAYKKDLGIRCRSAIGKIPTCPTMSRSSGIPSHLHP